MRKGRSTIASTFSISILAARTRVPKETIRHYLRKGLLPEPERVASNRFLYDRRHVESLRLIREMRRQRGLPLEAIARVMPELLKLGFEAASRPEAWDAALRRRGEVGSTQERLVRAGMELFSRAPHQSVTVGDVCEAAGVGRAGFYRRFRSKEELLLAAARTAVGDALEAFRAQRGRSGSVPSAARALAEALRPALPLLTQALAGAAQRRAGHAALLRRLYDDATAVARERVRGPATGDAGRRVVDLALGVAMKRTIQR